MYCAFIQIIIFDNLYTKLCFYIFCHIQKSTVKYWSSNGASKRKLVVGMPLYGRSYTLENKEDNGFDAAACGQGKAGKFTDDKGYLSYNEVTQIRKNVSLLSYSLKKIVIDIIFSRISRSAAMLKMTGGRLTMKILRKVHMLTKTINGFLMIPSKALEGR